MDPRRNDYAFDDSKIFIVVNLGQLGYLDFNEINWLLAHEYRYIVNPYVFCYTIATLLLDRSVAYYRLIFHIPMRIITGVYLLTLAKIL